MAALAAGMVLSFVASAQTTRYYADQVSAYQSVADYALCDYGVCANYSTSMGVSGWFETGSPLPANLPLSESRSLVTAFSFTDGVNTYSSSDPNVRSFRFWLSTNSASNIGGNVIIVSRWLNGTSPHAASALPAEGDRVAYVSLIGQQGAGNNNWNCSLVDVSGSGDADTCITMSQQMEAVSTGSGAQLEWRTVTVVPPVLQDDAFTVPRTTASMIDVLANDEAGVVLDATYTLVLSNPAAGSLSYSGGRIQFTPTNGFAAPLTFQYRACNSQGGCATATVTLIPGAAMPIVTAAMPVPVWSGWGALATSAMLGLLGVARMRRRRNG